MNKKTLFSLCATSIFTALAFVLEAYGKIPLPTLEISLAFVPILLCGILLGPLWGASCAFAVDLMATLLAGQGGYFLGFAPVVISSGLLYGLIGVINRRTKKDWLFCLLGGAVAIINGVICEGVLKSLAIAGYMLLVSKSAEALTLPLFLGIFASRVAFFVIQSVAIFLLSLAARKLILPKIKQN